jgi:starvation-inducible outer membrane lipoprotein
MKHHIQTILISAAALLLSSCVVEVPSTSQGNAPAYGQPLTAVTATEPVPQKVIDDCLAVLRNQVGQQTGMKVISAKRGESSFIIDVKVDSAEKPWRCFHDGTKCTGTEYQGEG